MVKLLGLDYASYKISIKKYIVSLKILGIVKNDDKKIQVIE